MLEIATARLQSGDELSSDLGPLPPDRVEEFRGFLPVLRLLQQLSVAPPVAGPESEDAGNLVLDDFRILREIGRGGMGIVYEAEQISMGRRVALKVLAFSHAVPTDQMLRFKKEARATASLNHPNIVPVYSIGCVGRLHYYTMLLIEGHSLDELITMSRRRSDPAWTVIEAADARSAPERDAPPMVRGADRDQYHRLVAQLGIQVSDALQHAHESGVEHRDIKPSNLLVAPNGHVWVTDFGLARISSELSLTGTGDLLGTLRYMPPEQVLANSLNVGHGADVYSLGATMYEMLTLRPAFPAQQRGMLLQQIADHEPRPPRQLDRSIPRDLETIVLKAMAERPEERYPTARDLSADLQRFLDGLPIAARRRSLLDHAAKFSRRNAPLVLSALVMLMLLVTGLVAGVIMVARQRDAALSATRRMRQLKEVAVQHEHQARQDAERAELNFRNAMRAVDRILQTVDHDLVGVPAAEQTRRILLKDALQFYEEFTQEEPANDAVRQQHVGALIHKGTIQHRLGRYFKSVEALEYARELLQQMISNQPWNTTLRTELATLLKDLAHLHLEISGHSDRAVVLTRQRIDLLGDLSCQYVGQPSYQCELASAFADYGHALEESGRWAEAETQYLRALDLWDGMARSQDTAIRVETGLANTHQLYGRMLISSLRPADAKRHLESAHRLRSQLASQGTLVVLQELAAVQRDLAGVHCKIGERVAAERYLRSSIAIGDQLARDFPEMVDHAYHLAACHYSLYGLLLAQQRHEEAERALQQSIYLLETLVDDGVETAKCVAPLARNLYVYGMRCYFAKNTVAAAVHFRRVARLLETCLSRHPEAVDIRSQLAWFLATCPEAQFQDTDRAVTLATGAVEHEPGDPQHWLALGAAQHRAGRWSASLAALEQVRRLNNGGDGYSWYLLSLVYTRLDQPEAGVSWYRRAVDWRHQHSCDSDRIASLHHEATRLVDSVKLAGSP